MSELTTLLKEPSPSPLRILKLSLPLMVSETCEALMLLTGVVLMLFEDDASLAAIGLIDAILLTTLSLGIALCDAFQNYYARSARKASLHPFNEAVFKGSWRPFFKWAFIITLILYIAVYLLGAFCSGETCDLLIQSLPALTLVIWTHFLGYVLYAYLVGHGHLRMVGIIAVITLAFNIMVTYAFLYFIAIADSSLSALLIALVCSEVFWVLLLLVGLYRSGLLSLLRQAEMKQGLREGAEQRIYKVLLKAAFIPGLSALCFHLAASLFFVYVSTAYSHAQAGVFTMAMAYYTLLLAPASGLSETALVLYSRLYSNRKQGMFETLRSRFLSIAMGASGILFALIVVLQLVIPEPGMYSLNMTLFVAAAAFFAIQNRLDYVAIAVRLRIGVLGKLKLFYGFILTLGLIWVHYWEYFHVLSLLCLLFVAHLAVSLPLVRHVRNIWIIPLR